MSQREREPIAEVFAGSLEQRIIKLEAERNSRFTIEAGMINGTGLKDDCGVYHDPWWHSHECPTRRDVK